MNEAESKSANQPRPKPRPENFGWHTKTGFNDEPSGWIYEGGREEYHEALEAWEKEKRQKQWEAQGSPMKDFSEIAGLVRVETIERFLEHLDGPQVERIQEAVKAMKPPTPEKPENPEHQVSVILILLEYLCDQPEPPKVTAEDFAVQIDKSIMITDSKEKGVAYILDLWKTKSWPGYKFL